MLTVIAMSCSTKKDTFTSRTYHNLTSHYNVYWNGRESLDEGIAEFNERVTDNYTEVLAVFNYGTDAEAQTIYPQMDRAIKKGSIAIQKHSMNFNGNEKVKWIDDCYMMIGEAYFYKKEYISARRTFNFINKEFGDNSIKYEAMLWLAQTYNQLEEYEKAEPLLNLITKDEGEGLVPLEVSNKLPQVYADHYIMQEKYELSIDYLYEALSYTPSRRVMVRMLFILAQIFQANDDLVRATDLYKQVIKKNPPYEMAFQAKINMAKSYDATSGDSKSLIKYLTKMIKDEKNKDYLDQIYYALAEVALKDNDLDKAIEYLALSVEKSIKNNHQKATSALKLADIYFDIPEYELAQAYYDTTMMFLTEDYPDYKNIKAKTTVLSELVVNLITIQYQDSLQRLVNMSTSDRNKIIDGIIAEYQAELERKRQEEALERQLERIDQQNSRTGGGPISPTMPVSTGKSWYFYNEGTKSYGYSEFIKKWGKRKLEDLWRLKDKKLTAINFDEEEYITADSVVSDSAKLADIL